MLTGLITCGVNARDIGIISPYRNQLKVMEQSLKGVASDDEIRDVEINTIDKYQVLHLLSASSKKSELLGGMGVSFKFCSSVRCLRFIRQRLVSIF